MVFYYVMREVCAGADCSYRPGRTYIDEVYRYSDQAQAACDKYNSFCHVAGVHYTVLPHSDTEPLPIDYFEPAKRPRVA